MAAILDHGLQPGEPVFDVAVRGGDEVPQSPELARARWLNGVSANPSPTRRRALHIEMRDRFELLGAQHPAAPTSRSVSLGARV